MMNPYFKFAPLLFTLLFASYFYAQEWQTPLVEGYGEVKYFDQAAAQPIPEKEYKLLFDVTSDSQKNGVNKRLWVVARTLNMMHVAGVPQENVNIVVAVHGTATFDITTEKAYQKKFGKSNPNIDLIEKLIANGVKIFVCSQATAARNILPEQVLPGVVPALSALSVLSNYQLEGYHLMP
jgi:intracellular sulfur oxidation DsrE/DsrF family protein